MKKRLLFLCAWGPRVVEVGMSSYQPLFKEESDVTELAFQKDHCGLEGALPFLFLCSFICSTVFAWS